MARNKTKTEIPQSTAQQLGSVIKSCRDIMRKDKGITGPELIAFINQDEAVRPDGKRGPGLFAYLRSLESANGDRRDVIARVFEGTVNRMVNGYLLRDIVNKINEIHFSSKDEIQIGRAHV